MKYYSEKLNKLFDTEKELLDAEASNTRLGYWKLSLSNAIDELARKNDDLERVIDDCVKEIGETLCDQLLDEIFENKATIKDNVEKLQNSAKKEEVHKLTQERINELLEEDNIADPINVTWNGLISLLNKVFGEDE